uniref:Major facilitator superfamily (MFS) profile domain-containing protein n=2 Tax=Caenorhabditis japonica TaxID=281687 RepID=A0A8R1ILG7_CAEJA
MFSYLLKRNESATETQFGWIMATSSFGHCVGCFVLGWWNSRTSKSSPSMHCGFLLMLASNLVYLLIDFVSTDWVAPVMMLSRLLGGLGMGNSSPMRTCASLHSTPSDRSKAMAAISGGRSVGTVVGPGLQLAFLPLGDVGIPIIPGFLSLHSENAPALLGIVLTMIGIVSLITMCEEQEIIEKADDISDFKKEKEEYPKADKLAMLICMLTRFVQNFMQISIDTLAPYILMMMYFLDETGSKGEYGYDLSQHWIHCHCIVFVDYLHQIVEILSRQDLQLHGSSYLYLPPSRHLLLAILPFFSFGPAILQ